jgi:hypothetical protein
MIKLATLAAVLAFAGAASAQTSISATLKAPAKTDQVVTAGVIWDCDKDVCILASDPSGISKNEMCGGLAKKLGPVAKFDGLNDDGLAKCNAVAKKV